MCLPGRLSANNLFPAASAGHAAQQISPPPLPFDVSSHPRFSTNFKFCLNKPVPVKRKFSTVKMTIAVMNLEVQDLSNSHSGDLGAAMIRSAS